MTIEKLYTLFANVSERYNIIASVGFSRNWCFHKDKGIFFAAPKTRRDIWYLHHRWSSCYSVQPRGWSIPYIWSLDHLWILFSSLLQWQSASLRKPWSQKQFKLQSPCTRLPYVINSASFDVMWGKYYSHTPRNIATQPVQPVTQPVQRPIRPVHSRSNRLEHTGGDRNQHSKHFRLILVQPNNMRIDCIVSY